MEFGSTIARFQVLFFTLRPQFQPEKISRHSKKIHTTEEISYYSKRGTGVRAPCTYELTLLMFEDETKSELWPTRIVFG
jgi:hypothetical protein